jgi:hypothetical protein
LFGLFFAIDEFDADNNQFRAVELAPVFLGFQPSLKTMVGVAIREPEPLVRWVRSRTVAKVDSMGLVVRRCDQCSRRKVIEGKEDFFMFLQAFAGLRKICFGNWR